MKQFQLIDICKRIIFAIQKFEKILKRDLVGPIDLVELTHNVESKECDIDILKDALENIENKKSFSGEEILRFVVAFHVGLIRISVMIRDVHNVVSLASQEILEVQGTTVSLKNKKKERGKKQ